MRISTVAAIAGTATAAFAQPTFVLTVLHNNDAESQVINAGSGLEEFGGAARFATLVDNLRAAAQNPALADASSARGSLLITSGDNFLSGPEFNAGLDAGVSFDAIALDLIGYDACALGNHEFDLGPDSLANFLQDFAGPLPVFVTANLDFSNEPGLLAQQNAGRLAASAVFTVDGVQVGVVGATTENLGFISSPRDTIINDVLASVQAEVDALTLAGVNHIILTSHLQSVDEELALATQLRGVDIIIAGGGDDLIADAGTPLVPGDSIERVGYPLTATDLDGNTVYVVSTAGDYKYLGRLEVGFDAAGIITDVNPDSNVVRVASTAADPVNGVDARPDVQAQVVDPVADFVANLGNNILATSEVGLDGVRDNVRSRETNLGNLIADAFLSEANRLAPNFGLTGADVALSNGGGIRNDNVLPAGAISELTTFDILPFGNLLTIVPNIPAEQFKEILENACSRIEPVSGDPVGSGTGRFAQVAGATVSFDPNRQARVVDNDGNVLVPGERVREIVLDNGAVLVENGQVVPGAQSVSIATGDFLARGGDQYPFNGAPFTILGISDQLALANFVSDLGLITAAEYPVITNQSFNERVLNRDFSRPIFACSPADLTGTVGVINFADVIRFITAFNDQTINGSLLLDLNSSGTVDTGDVNEFTTLFNVGCP